MSNLNQYQGSDGNQQEVYNQFRTYLESVCGIVLGDNKQFLVESRLNQILRSKNIASLGELMDKLHSRQQSSLKQIIVDAMTTNETMWFRDLHPYECLKNQIFKELSDTIDAHRVYEIRIWSAACSSGQEPYSISMAVEEAYRIGLLSSNIKVKIIATDISKGILEIAKSGTYDKRSINRGLPPEYLKRYFHPMGAGCYQINPKVGERIEFHSINLKDSFINLGKFDVVFCRNVLIYFSQVLKKDVLTRIHGALKNSGYLFLGGSETPGAAQSLFEMKQHGTAIVYQAK